MQEGMKGDEEIGYLVLDSSEESGLLARCFAALIEDRQDLRK